MQKHEIWDVPLFLKEHREINRRCYQGIYDDCDKYEIHLTGSGDQLYRFLEQLKYADRHLYLKIDEALIKVHLNRLMKSKNEDLLTHIVTLFHVGSHLGQAYELEGWKKWLFVKSQETGISMGLYYRHPQQEVLYQLY